MNQEYSDLLLIFIILILFFLVIYLLFKNKSNTSTQENDSINVQKNIIVINISINLLVIYYKISKYFDDRKICLNASQKISI